MSPPDDEGRRRGSPNEPVHTVAALAGRRIDDPAAGTPRFPLQRADSVKQALAALLREQKVDALVASAACGADLLGLEAAEQAGIRRRVVLPFGRERFKRTSVTDRPGDWGDVFDRLIAAADRQNDLVELAEAGDENAAYVRATELIVQETLALAGNGRAIAIIVWEGTSRGAGDVTETFRKMAREAGMAQFDIETR